MSSIIKKSNATHLLKIYFEGEERPDSIDNSFFSSLSSLVTTEENNNRLREEQLLNFYKEQAEKIKKDFFSLKKEFEEVNEAKNSLQKKLKITEEALRSIKQEEEKIIIDAKTAASELIENAKKEEKKIRQNAYDEGFNSGKEQCELEATKRCMKKIEDVEKVVAAIKDMGNDLINQYEAKLIQLVMTIVKTIVKKEVEIDSSIIKDCIKNALEEILDKSMVVIHINPDDYNIINEYLTNQFKSPGSPEIILSKDTNIHRGGALIESKMGVIDVTMQTRWEILEKILDKALLEKTSLSLYH